MSCARRHHTVRTAALLGVFTGMTLLAGRLGGGPGLVIAALVSLAVNAVAYFPCDTIALRAMGA